MRLKEAMEIAATCCDFCTGFDGPEPITVNRADEAAAALRRLIPFVEAAQILGSSGIDECFGTTGEGKRWLHGGEISETFYRKLADFSAAFRAMKEGK